MYVSSQKMEKYLDRRRLRCSCTNFRHSRMMFLSVVSVVRNDGRSYVGSDEVEELMVRRDLEDVECK
jgi:hypothetical protein